MAVCEVRELKQLRDANSKLKKLVAELCLDNAMLQDIAAKCMVPAAFARAGKQLQVSNVTSTQTAFAVTSATASNTFTRSASTQM